MYRFLEKGEVLVHVADLGLRTPDSDIPQTVPLYRVMQQSEMNNGLTSTEKECCEDIAEDFLGPFKRYMDAKKHQKAEITHKAVKIQQEDK